MRSLIACVFVLAIAGCADRGDVVTPGTPASSIQTSLSPGETIRPFPEPFSITFNSVTADSRCPLGALCIWAGDGATWFTLRSGSGAADACTLHTALQPQFVVSNGFRVELVGLAPFRRIDSTIAPASYVATINVSRVHIN